jgi:hypothetical protein
MRSYVLDRLTCAMSPASPALTLDLEAAIRTLRLNLRKNIQDYGDFRKLRSSFRCPADEASSNKETDDACDGLGEGDRGQRKGLFPTTEAREAMATMGRFNDELRNAGILLTADGLKPSAQGKRIAFDGPSRTIIDGPFAEVRELVAGFWLWEGKEMDEAVAWVKRCPNPMPGPSEIEIRTLHELADLR